MIDVSKLRLAMRNRLFKAIDSTGKLPLPIQDVPIAWENHQFTPPSSGNRLWIRETWLPASEQKVATGVDRLVGIFQYDAFDFAGAGTTQVDALALLIGNAFPPATSVNYEKTQVAIQRTQRGTAERRSLVDRGVWYQIPVRVTIFAYEYIQN